MAMKRRLCQQFVNSGGNHTACPFFAKNGWCSYAHGEHELNTPAHPVAESPPHTANLCWYPVEGKRKFDAPNGSTFKVTRVEHDQAPHFDKPRMKTRLCQQFMDSLGDDRACPHFARNGWCAYAHGEHELGIVSAPPRQADASHKLLPAKRKTKLCQPFVEGGGLDNSACPHFARHGWCAYAHGDHELESSLPPLEAPIHSLQTNDASDKLITGKRKTKLCQPFLDSGGDNTACPHFTRHGWCAYAHGEHELEQFKHDPSVSKGMKGSQLGDAQSSLLDADHKVSMKLNAARLKSRMCQQYQDSGGNDAACPHFVRLGWCAYAHGEHELEDFLKVSAEMGSERDPISNEVEQRVSPKLAVGRMKTRLCQQFIDGGEVDTACSHFARHGWCAYAHGEHEIEEPAVASNSRATYREEPRRQESQLEHGVSAKLNSSRMKTRLCQQFINSGGRDDACPHFVRLGWCAYAHGDHELGQLAPVAHEGGGVAAFAQETLGPAPHVSAKLDSSRLKTRLCQQFMDGGGTDQACAHFSRHGWCAYAHGEHELDTASSVPASPRAASVLASPRNGGAFFQEPPVVSAKLDKQRLKSRLCQQFVDGGRVDAACVHFSRHGWCAYAHGEHELEPWGEEAYREEATYQQNQGGLEVSAKLDSSRMKTRLCQQFINSGGRHDACPHFVRNGWCAYAHGERELDKSAASSYPSHHTSPPVYQHLPPAPAPQASLKLDPQRRKTRLCQQYVDGGWVDFACSHFAQHGWCAYAHGEHELEHLPPTPLPSAKLNPTRRKTKLCQQFVDSGGQDSACPFFAQQGWCAYAHGAHELESSADLS